MGILREQELIKEASLAIQSFEMKFGTGAIAWHASVDMIHLLYGIVHCPVYVEVYKGEELLESSLADCDKALYGIEDYSHSEGQRHATFAGEYRIVVRPLANNNAKIPSPIYGDQGTVKFDLRLNLVDALTDDESTSDALQRYLNERTAEEQRQLKLYKPATPKLPVEAMRPVLWDLLESRVRSILRPLLGSELSEKIDGINFERVWIGVKVLGDRNKGMANAIGAFPFDYSIRWIPTESQMKLAEHLLGVDSERAKQVLTSETSIGARSTMDTCASSGFLTTKIGEDLRAVNISHDSSPADRDFNIGKLRHSFFELMSKRMKGDEPELILVDIPIHVHSCVYFLVRCPFHYHERPRTIVFLNEYITILSSQLRQLAQETILRDLDDRIEHSLLSDPDRVIDGLQATFPMPKWHIERRAVEIEEAEPRYWHAHFTREEDTDAFKREISRVLQRRDLVEFQSAKLPYLEEARLLADRAIEMRMKNPTKFSQDEVGKPTVLYAKVKKLETNPVIVGRGSDVTETYRAPKRAMLIAGMMIGALANFLFDGQQKQSLFVKKMLLASDTSGTLRWTKYSKTWKDLIVKDQLYPGEWKWPEWEQLFPDGQDSSEIELSNREADEIIAWVRWSRALILSNWQTFLQMAKALDAEESRTGARALSDGLNEEAVKTGAVVPSIRKYLSRMRTAGSSTRKTDSMVSRAKKNPSK